jgi:putative peptidoglycan lipid II flippase
VKDFKRTLSSALRQAMAISFPATVGLVLLREPVIRVIYQRRAFDAAAAEAVAPVLTGYAVGLFAYTAAKIVVPAFLSLQDARTPMRVGLAMTLLDFGLNCVAVFAMERVWGLALSTSLCAALQTVILLYILRRRIGLLGGRQIASSVLRIALATAFMGVVVHGALKVAGHVSPGTGGWANLVGLLLPTVCGLLSYPLFCHLFRVGELRDVFRAFRKGESE